MTSAQIKIGINSIIDEIPEEILPDILDFLQQLRQQPNDKIRQSNHLRKILSEDKELFRRLAK